MSDFIRQYTSYSDIDLLKIIEDANNYQPLAVSTAQTILNDRRLPDNEIETLKATLAQEREEKEAKYQLLADLKNKMKTTGVSFFDALNPIEKEHPETERLIGIMCFVFGIIFLFHFYTHFGIIRFMFFDNNAVWDLDVVLYFLPLFIIPIALLLFYFRKRMGLLLLTIFFTYTAVHIFGIYLLTRSRQPSGIDALDGIFPKTPMATQLMTFIFYSGALVRICKDDIQKMYQVSKNQLIATIGITILLSVLIAYRILQ